MHRDTRVSAIVAPLANDRSLIPEVTSRSQRHHRRRARCFNYDARAYGQTLLLLIRSLRYLRNLRGRSLFISLARGRDSRSPPVPLVINYVIGRVETCSPTSGATFDGRIAPFETTTTCERASEHFLMTGAPPDRKSRVRESRSSFRDAVVIFASA